MKSDDSSYSNLEDMMNDKYRRTGKYSTTESVIKKFKTRTAIAGGLASIIIGFGTFGFLKYLDNQKYVMQEELKEQTSIYIDKELKNTVYERVNNYKTDVNDFVINEIDNTLDRELEPRLNNKFNSFIENKEEDIITFAENLIRRKINEDLKKYRLENERIDSMLLGKYMKPREAFVYNIGNDNKIRELKLK